MAGLTSQISRSIRPNRHDSNDTGDTAGGQRESKVDIRGRDAMPIDSDQGEDRSQEEVHHDEAEGDEDQEYERQRPLRDAGTTDREEIDEHNLSHIIFRPWCEACVKARA